MESILQLIGTVYGGHSELAGRHLALLKLIAYGNSGRN